MNDKTYYLITAGDFLQFFVRTDKDGMPVFEKILEVRAKGHAAAIYEAARKKKLKFHA